MSLANVIIVEPSALLRLGIIQLLQEISPGGLCEGIDYGQLFKADAAARRADLMLLSIPADLHRTIELIEAAQQRYRPNRILLLSDAPTLTFALDDLTGAELLAGHVSKAASTAILAAAVNLVMAGGSCFPNPGGHTAHSTPPAHAGDIPRRRWYEQLPSPSPLSSDDAASQPGIPSSPHPAATPTSTAILAEKTQAAQTKDARTPAGTPATETAPAIPPRRAPVPMSAAPAAGNAASSGAASSGIFDEDVVQREADLLNLTPRQYEVLTLLARGYPIKTISRKLKIAISTAKTHTDTLYQRLSVHNGQAAVYEALTRGATLGLSQRPLNQISAAQRAS